MLDAKTQIQMASDLLLQPNDLSMDQCRHLLSKCMLPATDYADLFLQYSQSESWVLERGIIKYGSFDTDAGFGLRVVSGAKTGFAHGNQCSLDVLKQAQRAVTSIARLGQDAQLALTSANNAQHNLLYRPINPINQKTEIEKTQLLQSIDRVLHQADPRICHVTCSLSADYDVVMILNHEGRLVADVRPLASLHVSAVMKSGDKRATGRFALGGRCSYAELLADTSIETIAKQVIHQAQVNLDAVPAPGGVMPVVLGPGWPAVLLHEAIGHGLEGDHIRRQASVFKDAVGEKIASEQCTIVDDATIAGARGSLNVDDEGEIGQRTILIEQGVVKGFMQDKHNASLMGAISTGNARRESYAHKPLVRMTNTMMLPGEHTPEEIIASIDSGIYCADFAGGQVDITSGQFVFSTSEAYLIEQGKITLPISTTTLVGDGYHVLQSISMVGNDLRLDNGQGVCGKDGQSVPVGVGQPTVRIDGLTVGGIS